MFRATANPRVPRRPCEDSEDSEESTLGAPESGTVGGSQIGLMRTPLHQVGLPGTTLLITPGEGD